MNVNQVTTQSTNLNYLYQGLRVALLYERLFSPGRPLVNDHCTGSILVMSVVVIVLEIFRFSNNFYSKVAV